MSRYPDDRLRQLRNNIDWKRLLEHWRWPHKVRAGQLAFQCPKCGELIAVVNPRTGCSYNMMFPGYRISGIVDMN